MKYKGVSRPKIPDEFPTGVLLGCVDLQTILIWEEYEAKLSEVEREACGEGKLYCWILKNPRVLIIPLKMKGKQKLWNLEKDVWEGVNCGLRAVPTGWWPQQRPNQNPYLDAFDQLDSEEPNNSKLDIWRDAKLSQSNCTGEAEGQFRKFKVE